MADMFEKTVAMHELGDRMFAAIFRELEKAGRPRRDISKCAGLMAKGEPVPKEWEPIAAAITAQFDLHKEDYAEFDRLRDELRAVQQRQLDDLEAWKKRR